MQTLDMNTIRLQAIKTQAEFFVSRRPEDATWSKIALLAVVSDALESFPFQSSSDGGFGCGSESKYVPADSLGVSTGSFVDPLAGEIAAIGTRGV